MCRKFTGGVFLGVQVPAGSFHLSKEDGLAIYASSGWAERGFCKSCGSSLFYRMTMPGPMQGACHIGLGFFDESSATANAKGDRAIALFDHIAPEVMLEITLQPPNILEAQVLEGGLELAIIPQHRQSTSLTYEYLYEERMVLCCGRGHVLFDAEDETVNLSAYKYAGFGFNSPNMKAGQDLGLKRAARVQEEEALALLIQSGRYIGYLADHVAAPLLAAGEVRVLSQSDSGYTSRFAAITRKKPIPDRKTLEFLNCLRTAHETQSSPR